MNAIPTRRIEASTTEAAIRVDLAACYRLVALYGWDDLIFTHISARVPGPEHHFLINPYGLMFEEITASSLVKIDLKGETVGDIALPRQSRRLHHPFRGARGARGRGLRHASAHARRHGGLHLEEGLLPLNQTAQLVLPDLAYHDYEGVALDLDERPRLQRDLGAKNIMLLHNHGTLAVGRTCAEAFLRMYFLERACTMQVRTRMLGGVDADHPTAPDVIDKNAALAPSGGLSALAEKLVWPALLRKLDRIDPGFRA